MNKAPLKCYFIISLILFLFSCSGLKLDKDKNCLNDKAACFKEDKTAPSYVQRVVPASNIGISTLPEIQLMFSEELNNPQPSDFTLSEAGMSIISVTQLDSYTYRLLTNRNPTIGGPLLISFPNLTDYNGNKITNGSTTITIDLTIPVLTTPNHYGVSTGGYPSIAVSWNYTYTPVTASNTLYTVKLTTGSTDCNAGTPVTPVTSDATVGVTALTSGSTYNFTLDTTVITSLGAQVILVCVDNIVNNKHGTGTINIVRDDTAPTTLTLGPGAGNYVSEQTLTFTCGDNSDRVIYDLASNVFSGTDPLASAVAEPSFNTTTGAVLSGNVYNPAIKPITPYSGNTTRTIYKYRCIDQAGNITPANALPALVSGVYRINSTYPTVNLMSLTRTGSVAAPPVTIGGVSTGGYTSARLQWSTNQAGQAWEIRSDALACGSGGSTVAAGSGGTATPTPANTPVITTITPASTSITAQPATYDIRICVTNGTDWAQVSFPFVRDDSAPALPTVNVPPASYGATQNLVFSCTDNADKIAYTQSFSTPAGAPADPLDPQFDADGVITLGAQQTGPLAITTDSTALVGKKTRVKWRCIDKAGNISPVNDATYTIDTLLPTVTVQSQDHPAISSVAGAYTTLQLNWVSDRSGTTYDIRRNSTNCLDGNVLSSGSNLSGAATAIGGVPITSTINANLTNFPTGNGSYTIHICVTNFASGKGYTSRALVYDASIPTIPNPAATIAQVDATNFTLTMPAASDNNAVIGYRIFRSLATGSYPAYPASPDYITLTNPVTLTMPDTQPYFLRVIPFDAAGNIPTIGSYYTEVTTKPSITVIVAGLTGNFDLTDGAVSSNYATNGSFSWTTPLGTGATYNFSFTTQPANQICSIRQLQFGSLSSNVTINVDCATGYMVGGTFQIITAAPLNYQLFRGNTTTEISAGSAGVSASFISSGVAINASGTIFVADPGTSQIYRYAGAGSLVSVAGNGGAAGIADGSGAAATFHNPSYITSDGSNLYISQVGAALGTNANDGIRKLDSAGNVRTLLTASAVLDPEGIAVSGNMLYWANRGSHEVKSLNLTTGAVAVVAGSNGTAGSADGTGTGATFNQPMGVVILNGKLYVTEFGGHRIRIINIASQVVTTLSGSAAGYADGPAALARFNGPAGIATDGFDLYLVDYSSPKVRRIRLDRSGGSNHIVSTIAGSGTSGSLNGVGAVAQFVGPVAIAMNGRQLFISDEASRKVRKITDAGLIGYWPIIPGVNPTDYSSDGPIQLNGTVVSGPLSTASDRFGVANLASAFNGTGQYVGGGDVNFTYGVPFTLAAWVNADDLTAIRPIFSSTGGGNWEFKFEIGTDGSVYFQNWNNCAGSLSTYLSNTGSGAVKPGSWVHVAFIYAANPSYTGGQIFINGRDMTAASSTGGGGTSIADCSGAVLIGRTQSPASSFRGAISDARIYSRALNEGELNELAQDASSNPVITGNSFSTGATGLLAHYKFIQGAEDSPSGPLGGTLSYIGTKTPVTGKDGDTDGALYYDGSSYYLGNVTGLPAGNAPRTMCTFIAPGAHPGAGFNYGVSYGTALNFQGFGIAIYQTGVAHSIANTYSSASDNLAGHRIALNTWNHLCASYDGTTSRLYLNGVLMGTDVEALNTTLSGFRIGSWLDSSQRGTGKLDDVRIYNNALSALQIRQLAVQVPAGLLARFDLSDTGATAADTSGRGETAAITGATPSADRFGIANQAYNFNGSSHMIASSDTGLPAGNSPRSLCAWVRPTAYPAAVWGHFIKYGGATTGTMSALALKNANQITNSFFGTDHDLTFTVQLNTWTHICSTYSGTVSLFYINGASIGGSGIAPTPNTTLAGAGGLIIGNSGYDLSQRFTGDVDDVRIYNRVLTAAEMRALSGYQPVHVLNGFTTMKLHLQPDSTSYAAGGCAGGVNCVSAWNDSSISANNVGQGTIAARPVFDPVGINGKSAVKFVGTSHTFLTGTCNEALNTANMTFFSVYNEGNTTGNNGIFQNGAQNTGKLVYLVDAPNRPALFDLQANGINLIATASFYNSAETVLLSMDFNGTAGTIYKNGSGVATSPGATSAYNWGSGLLHIGRYYFGGVYPSDGGYYDGFMGDMLYFDTVLGMTDRNIVQCYLSGKYAAPLTGVVCP